MNPKEKALRAAAYEGGHAVAATMLGDDIVGGSIWMQGTRPGHLGWNNASVRIASDKPLSGGNFMRVLVASLVGILAMTLQQASAKAETYVARLTPLNSSVTKVETSGEAKFTIQGDNLTVTIDVKNAPPGIAHLQHFHGFKTGDKNATCATAEADANRDGVIDLIETEPVAGTTMVPFHDNPVSMEIPSETYPKASADGSYRYEKTISLKGLKDAFRGAFDQDLDLDRRVVFIHGISPDTKLPDTVASLGQIPAHVTLPIACGAIEKAG